MGSRSFGSSSQESEETSRESWRISTCLERRRTNDWRKWESEEEWGRDKAFQWEG